MPMTDSERRRVDLQGLRGSRRVYRAADTAGEVLERWLDRMIARKTRVTCSQLGPGLLKWEDYRNKVQSLEKSLADVSLMACE